MTDGGSILIVDDEPDVVTLVASNLKGAGFKVLTAGDGAEALGVARREEPALIVLDLNLPQMSGLEVCRVLRGDPTTARIPIVMLTAKAEEVDRIVGLELGADDYVTKPFSPRELVLRVRSVLRRGKEAPEDEEAEELNAGDITLDVSMHVVKVRGRAVDLTATEFKLLKMLLERRGRVQSREGLLKEVWGYENSIDTRTVDTHMRRLREKLGKASDQIETVRGFGYRIGS